MSLDVLFISSKGSQYRYFTALAKSTRFKAEVSTLLQGFAFKFFGNALTKSIVTEGLEYHLERKRRKYKNFSPNPIVFKLYRYFSAIYFALIYCKFSYVLNKKKPSAICLWNGHRLPEMAIKAVARHLNIPIAYFENGLLPDTTTMDFSGVNALSSIPKDPEFYLKSYGGANDFGIEASLDARMPHKKRASINFEKFDFKKKYIFVPFQVNFDSQVVINSPRINSMQELYDCIYKVVESIDDKGLIFVIKEHPSDARTYSELHTLHPRIKFVDENTEELIRNAYGVITLNSSVGIESLMLAQKVILLGDACYGIDGLAMHAHSNSSLVEIINTLKNFGIDEKLRIAFFRYLKEEYLLPGAWQKEQFEVDVAHLKAFEEKIKRQRELDFG